MIARVELRPTDGCVGGRARSDAGAADRLLGALDLACSDFPQVDIAVETRPSEVSFLVHLDEWRNNHLGSFLFDGALDRLATGTDATLVVVGPPEWWTEDLPAILSRAQRCAVRTNEASDTDWFRSVLVGHRKLHELSKPLVLADYRHAIDTWQWVLRLLPTASVEIQLAAVFHDVERLFSEADQRVEHHAADYPSFKDAHAGKGAEMTRAILRELGAPADVVNGTCELVARHERSSGGELLAALNDADALSFFSLNSDGFVAYYGTEHTRRKVRYTLERLRPKNRWRLGALRLRSDVRAMVASCLDGANEERSREARR